MDLKIKYADGSMTIHLENFLNCRSISKVKKLVKIIRSSFTPECEGIFREDIEQEIEQFEPRQREITKYIIGYTGEGEVLSDTVEQLHHKQGQKHQEQRFLQEGVGNYHIR